MEEDPTQTTVRTVPEMEETTASRAVFTITVQRVVLIIGITVVKDARAAVLGEIRTIRTIGETARTVRTTMGIVPRAVLTTEKIDPDLLETTASRAVSEARMKVGEIPEESREINLKAQSGIRRKRQP